MNSLAMSQAPALAPIEEYVPLVRKVATRIARRLPSHIRFEDLVGAGILGLMQAADRYDAAKVNKSFEQFAEFRIKGAIYDELRRRDLMSRDARSEAKRLEKSVQSLTSRLGRAPSDDEIAEVEGVDVAALREMFAKLIPVTVVSTDEATSWDVEAGPSPYEAVERDEMRVRLATAIKKLSERQQNVLSLYYMEELTLKQIGELLEVSESRVCQVIGEITVRLRSLLGVELKSEAPTQKRKAASNA